jgi:hypothetical protein
VILASRGTPKSKRGKSLVSGRLAWSDSGAREQINETRGGVERYSRFEPSNFVGDLVRRVQSLRSHASYSLLTSSQPTVSNASSKMPGQAVSS